MHSKMPEGDFRFPKKSSCLILDQKLLPINTLLIKQGLSKKGFLTFHNACGCKWRHWCSQDYRLIRHKYVSIGGGLLSEKMAMGNSILYCKRFIVPGFSTYASVRENSLFWKSRNREVQINSWVCWRKIIRESANFITSYQGYILPTWFWLLMLTLIVFQVSPL